ncbi:hypothetical protein QAD02_005105, partial [Eretmocerus hayati]
SQKNNGPESPESLFPVDTDKCLADHGLDSETMTKKYGGIETKYDMKDAETRCYATCKGVEDLRVSVSEILNDNLNGSNGNQQYDEEQVELANAVKYCSTI